MYNRSLMAKDDQDIAIDRSTIIMMIEVFYNNNYMRF